MRLVNVIFWPAIGIFFIWTVLAKIEQEITTYEFFTLVFLNILAIILKRIEENEAVRKK